MLANGGFDRSGPDYIPSNAALWRFIVTLEEGVESARLQSKKIEEMMEQTMRLIHGSVDASNNGNEFSVTVTERELQPAEWPMLFCLRQ
jgi:hypothetical protein